MKQIGLIKKWMGCGLAVLALSLVTSAQAETVKQGKATVRAVRGTAKYKGADGVWLPLKVGKNLGQGDTVSTSPDTTVDLFLGQNGPVVRVTGDTTMGLDALNYTDTGADAVINTQLNLSNGRILGNVKKLASASKYEIKTPNGVAGIRGTDFDVTVEVRGQQYVVHFTSVSGTLIASAVVNGQTVTSVINTGETWTPGTGGNTTVPAAALQQAVNLIADALKVTLLITEIGPTRTGTVPTVEIVTRIDPQTGSDTGNGSGSGNHTGTGSGNGTPTGGTEGNGGGSNPL
ncbi:MAG: FecR protein [Verrucomicrobiales bacterium]|nr:FecR protein [Verrucomicrobiales bacterium]